MLIGKRFVQASRSGNQFLYRNPLTTTGESRERSLEPVYLLPVISKLTSLQGCILWQNYWPLLTGRAMNTHARHAVL